MSGHPPLDRKRALEAVVELAKEFSRYQHEATRDPQKGAMMEDCRANLIAACRQVAELEEDE